MLPRSGGVLDQSSGDMLRIEEILDSFAEYDKLEERRSKAKNRNKS